MIATASTPLAWLSGWHQPQLGKYGACARCLHGDADGSTCSYPGQSGPTSTRVARGQAGHCGPNAHALALRATPQHTAAQLPLQLA